MRPAAPGSTKTAETTAWKPRLTGPSVARALGGRHYAKVPVRPSAEGRQPLLHREGDDEDQHPRPSGESTECREDAIFRGRRLGSRVRRLRKAPATLQRRHGGGAG